MAEYTSSSAAILRVFSEIIGGATSLFGAFREYYVHRTGEH
jgi:hypothetical protein